MKITDNCIGCSACSCLCPCNAIEMVVNSNGFITAKVDDDKCVGCNKCVNACKTVHANHNVGFVKAYHAYLNNDAIRMESSSGGVFTALAQATIKRSGVVFGAAFNENNEVEHISVTEFDELYKLRGSKYIQSNIASSYADVKKHLENGVEVLFSGTPCQVSGLLSFLGKGYDNLTTVDLICHGVTSPGFWKDYLKVLSKSNNISDVNFRDKITGWHRFSFSYRKNGKKIEKLFIDDPFCFLFDKHYILNTTCFECEFAGKPHKADITLGDFWGVEKYPELFDDNKGVSLSFANTDKGAKMLNEAEKLCLTEVDGNQAIKSNHSAPAKKPEGYDVFWEMYNEFGIKKVINTYFYNTRLKRVKLLVKSILVKTKLIKIFIK